MLHRVHLDMSGFDLTILSVDRLINITATGNCKFNYHTTSTAPTRSITRIDPVNKNEDIEFNAHNLPLVRSKSKDWKAK